MTSRRITYVGPRRDITVTKLIAILKPNNNRFRNMKIPYIIVLGMALHGSIIVDVRPEKLRFRSDDMYYFEHYPIAVSSVLDSREAFKRPSLLIDNGSIEYQVPC